MRRPSLMAGVLILAAAVAATVWPETGDGTAGERAPGIRAQEVHPPTPGQREEMPPAWAAAVRHETADRGPEQPIPFSHRWHVSELQIQCAYCHTGAEKRAEATVPPLNVCMGCHRTVGRGLPAVDTLVAYWEREETVPWKRVYKVPEFVQFTHQAHLRNDIACQECHGPVEEMDRVYRATSLSMGWCLSCHRSEPRPTDVATTALLVEEAEIPEAPPGPQDVGLYPYTIDQGYAGSRAPDDCATCHY